MLSEGDRVGKTAREMRNIKVNVSYTHARLYTNTERGFLYTKRFIYLTLRGCILLGEFDWVLKLRKFVDCVKNLLFLQIVITKIVII